MQIGLNPIQLPSVGQRRDGRIDKQNLVRTMQLGNYRGFGMADTQKSDFIMCLQGGLQLTDNIKSDPIVTALRIAETDDVEVP